MSEAETNPSMPEPSSEVTETEIPETTPKPFLIRPVPALAQEALEPETQQGSNLGADSEETPDNKPSEATEEGLSEPMSGASGAADLTTPPTAEETEDTAIMAGKREGAFDRGGTGAQMPGIDPELSKQPDPDSLPDRPATAHKTEEFEGEPEVIGGGDDEDAYPDSGRSPRQPGEASNYLAGLSEEELDEREERIKKAESERA